MDGYTHLHSLFSLAVPFLNVPLFLLSFVPTAYLLALPSLSLHANSINSNPQITTPNVPRLRIGVPSTQMLETSSLAYILSQFPSPTARTATFSATILSIADIFESRVVLLFPVGIVAFVLAHFHKCLDRLISVWMILIFSIWILLASYSLLPIFVSDCCGCRCSLMMPLAMIVNASLIQKNMAKTVVSLPFEYFL